MKLGKMAAALLAPTGVLGAVAVSLASGQVPAGPAQVYDRLAWEICIDKIPVFVEELIPIRVPVGCEVIDCCPGCPGPGPLDWRVRFEGETLGPVALEFDNLPAGTLDDLRIEGEGTYVQDGRIVLGQGESMISGLPGNLDLVPVATPMFGVDQRRVEAAAAQADSAEEQGVEFIVEQMLGRVVVAEFRLRYTFRHCFTVVQQDIIDLNNNIANDDAVVCVDGNRTSGCVDDETWRGDDRIGVGRLQAAGACNSEVAVFSDDNAMALLPNVTAWTNANNDKLDVDLDPLIQAPVAVWIAVAGGGPRATADLANANLLYNTNHLGVQFNGAQTNVVNNQQALNTIGTGCANAGQVQGSAFFTANQLNVYYVNSAFTGVNCGANRNIQYVGTTANNQTLVHEFGHAHSLGHTNGLAGFPATNVMIGGGAARTHFSEGQAFRVNVNTNSVLNTNGERTGTTRNCPDGTTSSTCPALNRDATPN